MDKKKVILVWFRNDLRLHDNEILLEAVQKADVVIPVYCFDPRYYQTNKFGHKNTGVIRAQFILETVQALKERLRELNSDLMTFHNYPEEVIPWLASRYEVDEVYHHREVAQRETTISEKVEVALWQSNKINLKHFIGHTMYHKEDLPFPIKDIPDSFSTFKKKVERESTVRPILAPITSIVSPAHLEATAIPSLQDLGYSEEDINQVYSKELVGGEQNALLNLEKLTQGNHNGFHDFTLISPYIATGALSPILTYHKLMESAGAQPKKIHENRISRLLWRDYFRFMLKKYPNVYFKEKGHGKSEGTDQHHRDMDITLWKNAHTGEPFIDETLSILKKTGNLPYEIRNIIGLYLIQETSHSWLEGAAFFEEHLLDYTPSTTYGYWAHTAAVGTSIKDNIHTSWRDAMAKSFPKGIQYTKHEPEILL